MQPDLVTMLADTAIRGKDLDEAKALDAKKKAEEAMQNKTSQLEYVKAQAELAEAIAQLAQSINCASRGTEREQQKMRKAASKTV